MTPEEARLASQLRAEARAIGTTPGGFVNPQASALYAQARAVEEKAAERAKAEREAEANKRMVKTQRSTISNLRTENENLRTALRRVRDRNTARDHHAGEK